MGAFSLQRSTLLTHYGPGFPQVLWKLALQPNSHCFVLKPNVLECTAAVMKPHQRPNTHLKLRGCRCARSVFAYRGNKSAVSIFPSALHKCVCVWVRRVLFIAWSLFMLWENKTNWTQRAAGGSRSVCGGGGLEVACWLLKCYLDANCHMGASGALIANRSSWWSRVPSDCVSLVMSRVVSWEITRPPLTMLRRRVHSQGQGSGVQDGLALWDSSRSYRNTWSELHITGLTF